jgi:hypothetical protein
MRFRKLRNAWSVAWGIACVLLVVLWVRSYSWFETDGRQVGQIWFGGSLVRGVIFLNRIDESERPNKMPTQYRCLPASGAKFGDDLREPVPAFT